MLDVSNVAINSRKCCTNYTRGPLAESYFHTDNTAEQAKTYSEETV